MNVFGYFREEVLAAVEKLQAAGSLPRGLDTRVVAVTPPREPAHGDLATNAALVLAGQGRRTPRELAGLIAAELGRNPAVSSAEVAGPGFINLRLTQAFWQARLADVLIEGIDYGASDLGSGRRVNVEYVSANPTGPLHVGHARGAVVGDALAALFEKVGFEVTREYYVNDAGAQVDTLARSTYWRYREALGERTGGIPEGCYPGEYLKPVGAALAERDGDKWCRADEREWLAPIRSFAIAAMMDLIRDDLKMLGVAQDVFTLERGLVEKGKVDATLKWLEERGLVYTGVLEAPKGRKPEDWEARPQTLFRATAFGDEVDRPLKKSDGSWTYFAPDIAYHRDKIERGFDLLINVWGADHAGYVERMKAAVKALSDGKTELDVKICQLVNLFEGGKPVKMSKRAGSFVSLREVVDAVGKDVVRFMMLTRKNDAPLDFDLIKVREQSKDNPVFYVQYAHVRVCSVMRHAAEAFPDLDLAPAALARADLGRLTDPLELDLMKTLANWPRLVEGAAETHEPHRVAFYLYDLAAAFHGLWTKGKEEARLRFLVVEQRALTAARLALVRAVGLVIASGLAIFGVTPVEEMR